MARILIVGKDRDRLQSIALELRAAGNHHVDVAANPYDALAQLLLGSYHLVAVELDVTQFDGMEVIQAAKNRTARALIIAARCEPTRVKEAQNAGAQRCLEGSLSAREIQQLLEN